MSMRPRHGCGLLLAAFALSAGCTTPERPASPPARAADHAAPERPTAASVDVPRIVVLGDSLTAGLGLDPADAYPALLQQRLDADDLEYEVVNAGVSGDTSAGALRRMDWALDGDVRILIVALGGNDGLRGLPAGDLRSNLAAIIEHAQARGIDVVLAGMEAPPNLGPAYTREFRQVYVDLAKEYRVAFVPFLLEGVAGIAGLNQRDGIHPNADGARLMADLIWPVLQPLAEARGGPAPAEP